MKPHTVIHWAAIVSLVIVAALSVENTIHLKFEVPSGRIFSALFGLAIWGRLWPGPGVAIRPYRISVVGLGVGALWSFLNAGIFIHTTRTGKFAVWAELLDRLDLKGDERLLDIGCGRGAVLLMAAERLPARASVRGRCAKRPGCSRRAASW
ncbi:MAG TPA: hypothetical protein VFD27_11205 [Chthoniobacteraceae bacterium]|nr:hypothetical protein [Chthoniobacteraceae bacterium]